MQKRNRHQSEIERNVHKSGLESRSTRECDKQEATELVKTVWRSSGKVPHTEGRKGTGTDD